MCLKLAKLSGKTNPLNLKWMRSQVRILGVNVSYNESENNELNFHLKLRKMHKNLNIWRARNLTLFEKVRVIESLGLLQLVYSASTLNVSKNITSILKSKLFSCVWKNKKKRKFNPFMEEKLLDVTTEQFGKKWNEEI